MRHGPSFNGTGLVRLGFASSVALMSAALSVGTAQAQTRPGWVDPPARQAVQPGADKAVGEKLSLEKSASEKPVTEKPVAETPATAKAQADGPSAQDAASAERIEAIIDRLRHVAPYSESLVERSIDEQTPKPAVMAAILETLANDHGGAAGWLREHGWDDAQLERLRTSLVN